MEKEKVNTLLEKCKYTHFNLGNGVVTVCHVTQPNEGFEEEEIEVFGGFAFCNPEDQFCRKVGREIARDQLRVCLHRAAADAPLLPSMTCFIETLDFNNIPIVNQSKVTLANLPSSGLPLWVKKLLMKDNWLKPKVRAKRQKRVEQRLNNEG